MKYKDTFIKYYVINPIANIYENFLVKLNYWWCIDCQKYHSPRMQKYYGSDTFYQYSCNGKSKNGIRTKAE